MQSPAPSKRHLKMSDVIERVFAVIQDRRNADPSASYVASLQQAGLNKILEKIGEEACEVVIAAKDAAASKSTTEVVKETADLWFHSLILLDQVGETPDNVFAELESRFGTSGITEKQSRKN
tara:strand:- start:1350 stop:1715 length:366 start_codon:yes stop_codon:yes gene_type:complete